MKYQVIQAGESRSFPDDHPLIAGGESSGEIVVITGADAGEEFHSLERVDSFRAVLIELGMESLDAHTGEACGEEGSNVLGFARFRLGDAPASDLVELVRQPRT